MNAGKPVARRAALFMGLVMGLFLPVAVEAQDATAALSEAYRVQFENQHVRVVRVHYPPGIVLPDHTHPAGMKVYVYLNDSEGIVFRHSGRMTHVTRRPPVKTGAMRVSGGPEEHHNAENTSTSPAEHLRIELKTVNARGGRRIPAATFRGESSSATEFMAETFAIERYVVAPGQSVTTEPPGTPAPALWITIPSGDTRWADVAAPETLVNTSNTPLEMVRVLLRVASQ